MNFHTVDKDIILVSLTYSDFKMALKKWDCDLKYVLEQTTSGASGDTEKAHEALSTLCQPLTILATKMYLGKQIESNTIILDNPSDEIPIMVMATPIEFKEYTDCIPYIDQASNEEIIKYGVLLVIKDATNVNVKVLERSGFAIRKSTYAVLGKMMHRVSKYFTAIEEEEVYEDRYTLSQFEKEDVTQMEISDVFTKALKLQESLRSQSNSPYKSDEGFLLPPFKKQGFVSQPIRDGVDVSNTLSMLGREDEEEEEEEVEPSQDFWAKAKQKTDAAQTTPKFRNSRDFARKTIHAAESNKLSARNKRYSEELKKESLLIYGNDIFELVHTIVPLLPNGTDQLKTILPYAVYETSDKYMKYVLVIEPDYALKTMTINTINMELEAFASHLYRLGIHSELVKRDYRHIVEGRSRLLTTDMSVFF